jgi:hypothetical protein
LISFDVLWKKNVNALLAAVTAQNAKKPTEYTAVGLQPSGSPNTLISEGSNAVKNKLSATPATINEGQRIQISLR